MSGQNQYGTAEAPTSVQTARTALRLQDQCHFSTAVRFGRRRTDQVGHLQLTSHWLKFRGALDVAISWSEVAGVERDGREIVVSLHGTRRTLRFWCQSDDEASRGFVVANHLSALAQADRLAV